MLMDYHKPVLLKETVAGLNIKPAGIYVDVTFGGGGHSREILSQLNSDGRLFAFDQDLDSFAWYEYNDTHPSNAQRFYALNGLASGGHGPLLLGELAAAGLSQR